ncbi:hypothetical protein LAV84_07015 [Rhizobium sp. VS19-DR104.2]|uniref:hypothetical protein n=1 Tax=unclassified Rhizobium TaxID=2613769 RepID=UPI001CC52BB1|nr:MULTISPECIES: hypothetical protein [unclassified Rhizobium]MBZ5760298.1 hypothetical protein [Rhizobium sp. VS19-DR96]MBZ5766858.1 hypothetical protein [Rhizobium sp. VS19-DR129.2]MBZ5773149.1 hypothetical protein [Rhizobium sp. VS19-DRK62.2]MBZ5784133.1 hypothetical protein [Rhizobium sp. VS19-DR121]MBZ5802493.1 hypothetical protein [Rhizobium sp. VS19-DR181]
MLQELLSSRLAQTIAATIISLVATQILAAKGKLRWSNRHAHSFLLPNAGQNGSQLIVHTREVWITNTGRSALEDIEIVWNWRPQHLELWNPREFTEIALPNNRFAIQVPNLAGKEFFSVSILSVGPDPLPEILNIRSKNDIAKMLPLLPTRQFPAWFNYCGLALIVIGIGTVFYALLTAAAILLGK